MKTLAYHTEMPLVDKLKRCVAAWCARHGVSARYLGRAALGDPDFVDELRRGRSVGMKTADRVLAFMGAPPLGPAFRSEVEAFMALTGTKPRVLGEEATGSPSFVWKLRRGYSPRLATIERVRTWMASNVSEEELQVIRGRVADTADMKPFLRAASCPQTTGVPSGGTETEGEMYMNENGKHYLSTREAAEWLGLSTRTLDRYRVSGAGPAFHRFGSRVRYLLADLEAWAAARRRTSTSDDGRRVA